MTTTKQVLSAVQIRGAEAVWVLIAHAYALLVPVAFCVAIYSHWDYLTQTTDKPWLFFVSAALFSAGAAFEVAQNTMDNWYLTEDTASANGVGFCDFLFYFLITAGQAVGAVALGGNNPAVVVLAVAAVVALPPIYLKGGPYFAPLGAASLLAIILAFQAFGSPVVFLQLLLVAATIYFFQALLRTKAQVLHGFTTTAASSGVWFLVWAISEGANGDTTSWLVLGIVVVSAVIAAVALWPYLTRLPESRRIAISV